MQELKPRTFQFAVMIGRLAFNLPFNTVNKINIGQLVRAASSIGANYRAAKRAKSDAGFIYKLKIVEEEAGESVYFLELLKEFNPVFGDRLDKLIEEGTEVRKIIVASINTARAGVSQIKN